MDVSDRYDLFVYGTLMRDGNVKALTGRTFHKDRGILWDYERIVPNTGYPYILPKTDASVSGCVLRGLSKDALYALDDYENEGRLYKRIEADALVGGKSTKVFVYVGIAETLREYYGEDMEEEVRLREYLERKAEQFVDDEGSDGPGEESELRLAAKRELLGTTLRDILASYQKEGPPSGFAAKYALKQTPVPSLGELCSEPEVRPYADNYIRLVVRHIIFSYLEEKIRREFAGSFKVPDKYYEYTMSNLVALAYANHFQDTIRRRMRFEGLDRFHDGLSYLDYASGAVSIVETIYSSTEAEELVQWIRSHRQIGTTPLGAEVELSDLGPRAVDAQPGEDPRYDSFYYFYDFGLANRAWKLGGYLDDHQNDYEEGVRSRGFFEYAFGRYKIMGDLSKPVTNDPWVLNQLIHETMLFAGVAPHSLHISIQPAEKIQAQRPNELDDLLCLLLLGGDLRPDAEGNLRERRLHAGELVHKRFSRVNTHTPFREDFEEYYYDTPSENEIEVMEYQFPRLSLHRSYEPLIMALKGFQIAKNPRPVNLDVPNSEIEQLMSWAAAPTPVPASSISDFLAAVETGLNKEADGEPAHSEQYIEECLALVQKGLEEANALLG